jgi:hypothetical protein
MTVVLMTVAYRLSQPKPDWDEPKHPWEDHRDHHDQ